MFVESAEVVVDPVPFRPAVSRGLIRASNWGERVTWERGF